MIGEKINSLSVVDNNNRETHLCEFDDSYDLYGGELVILDLYEIGYRLAESLEQDKEAYGWDEVERKDMMNEIEGYFSDIVDFLVNRIEEVFDDDGVDYEKV